MTLRSLSRWLPLLTLTSLLTACAANNPSLAGFPPVPHASTPKIQHVVIIVQENRSFDNLFYGYPGAHTANYGRDDRSRKVALKPIGLETTWDLDHSSGAFFADCNGTGSFPGTGCRMNGFTHEYVGCGHQFYPRCPTAHPQYAYVPHAETKPYFEMARRYVLADHMFPSNFDGSSFVSHQYLIAGEADSTIDYPYTTWGCEGGVHDKIATLTQQRTLSGRYIPVCFNGTTLGDELDAASVPWGYYAEWYFPGYLDIWSAYQAIRHVYYGPDWKKDVLPNTQFFDDVKGGRLRAVSWVTPSCANSDHAGCGSNTGPSWVASLVNAVGESKYWSSTAIFVFWDDYGGWYDDVGPPLADYDGLGIRVPMLVISPYAKHGYVSHVQYEHGSILKFVEDLFGLSRLAASDTRANSPEEDCFDFTAPPRAFIPIAAPHDENYFRRQPADPRPPDDK